MEIYTGVKKTVEYDACETDIDLKSGKPVTTFGYDSILFIDDNMREGDRLKRLFSISDGRLDKDVTFFSGYYFSNPDAYSFIEWIALAEYDDELKELLPQFLQTLRDENGCLIMCDVIDDFITKEYESCLTIVDDKYRDKYREYRDKVEELEEIIEDKAYDIEDEYGLNVSELIHTSDGELDDKYSDFFSSDRHQIFEGLDFLLGNDDRTKLDGLIKTAREKEENVKHAKELLDEYQQIDENRGKKGQEN